jgi:hypothetical protein
MGQDQNQDLKFDLLLIEIDSVVKDTISFSKWNELP